MPNRSVPLFFITCLLNPSDTCPKGFDLMTPSIAPVLKKPLISADHVFAKLNCSDPFSESVFALTVTSVSLTIPSNLLLYTFAYRLCLHHFVIGTFVLTERPN